jgi:hypothetical protein
MSGDDEWACKVAMCMSNPGGPTESAECVEPVNRLHRHLAKGGAFPVCSFTGGGSGEQQDPPAQWGRTRRQGQTRSVSRASTQPKQSEEARHGLFIVLQPRNPTAARRRDGLSRNSGLIASWKSG